MPRSTLARCPAVAVLLAALATACTRPSGAAAASSVTSVDASADSARRAALARENDAAVRPLLAALGDRASKPAGEVFENVQIPWLRTVPAGTFLSIMNGGYAKSLGVSCTHCHTLGNFASDEKRPKRAAREMAAMHRMINQQLAKMENLATPPTANRAISCISCHRGTIDPRVIR